MIGVDTNILARFYVDDPADPEAAKQRPVARRILAESRSVFVPLTVVLEFEWVLRAFYGFTSYNFIQVVEHLMGLPNVNVEQWSMVADALDLHAKGLDFADALHLSAATECEAFVTFDNRRFARRATNLGVVPPVSVPAP